MKPYLVKTPAFVKRIYANRIWCIPNSEKSVYLTFDDGPIPEVTPWILDILKDYNAKATFFCIGDNVQKHSDIFKRIITEGHSIGNHTMHHLNGWKSDFNLYFKDTILAQEQLNKSAEHEISHLKSNVSNLFRPPYGKLTTKQSSALQNKGYKIIMWDVLSADYDNGISEEKCLQNVVNNIEEGSIVVFHDSLKAEKNLRYTLPKTLEFIQENNWVSKALS